MRCPHCDDPVEDGCGICPTCNKDVRPVPSRKLVPVDPPGLREALKGIQTEEHFGQTNTTKRCPFCAEEILAQAIVCKHCRRDISSGGQLPFTPIPGAAETSGVMYFLAAAVGILLSLFALGPFGPFLVVVLTSIWAATDAATHKMDQYQQSLGGPAAVFFGSLLLWIFVFPWYLAIRSRIRAGLQPAKS